MNREDGQKINVEGLLKLIIKYFQHFELSCSLSYDDVSINHTRRKKISNFCFNYVEVKFVWGISYPCKWCQFG